jgi:sentrin-specific protease 8
MEYQRLVLFPDHKNVIEILGPSLVEFLKSIPSSPSEEELLESIKPLHLMCKKVVLAVIHNPKGAHWSLLVFIPNGNFYHLDSLNSINKEVAKAFASRLMLALKLSNCEFIEKPSSKQDNSYDCGLFVIANSEKTLEHIISDGKPMSEDFKNPLQLESKEKRKELLNIVQVLAKQES